MKPDVRSRAALARAVIAMDERARLFTAPELSNPFPDRSASWTCASKQAAQAVFVRFLLHGFEALRGVHLLPGTDLEITDGFETVLLQAAPREFGAGLTPHERGLLAQLARAAETSPIEEGIFEPQALRDVLQLSLTLGARVLAEVARVDPEVAVLAREDLPRWEAGEFGEASSSAPAALPRWTLMRARGVAALLLDEGISSDASLDELKRRVDERLERMLSRGASPRARSVATLRAFRRQLDDDVAGDAD
ncbi:MAG TPA: hypothetical protein VMU33_18110 [Burkholderiaceae bacterium]|nr:hypothetical protein [Burkholderiaceae bacterium]